MNGTLDLCDASRSERAEAQITERGAVPTDAQRGQKEDEINQRELEI